MAVLWVTIVAVVDAIYGGKFGLIGFLAIGPFIAAAFAGPRRTALVGLYATLFSIILSTPPRQYDQLNHFLRVLTLLASSGVATWISYLRSQRNRQLLVGPHRDPHRTPAPGRGRDRAEHAGTGAGADDLGRSRRR